MLHRNGTPPVFPYTETQPASAAVRTEFPPDRPVDSSRALIYHLSRRQVAGLPAIRWLYFWLGIISLLALLLPMPWPWLGVLGPLLIIAVWLWQWTALQGSYVRFTPAPPPLPVEPRLMPPSAKLPVYVSGLLSVENKVRRFAGLPGFYRTFATREHALLCQARRRTGLAAWPEDEVGLWYAFFAADHVHALHTGAVAFDRTALPGFALDYTPPQPLGGKKSRRPQRLTLYVAFANPADFQAVLADLAVEPLAVSPASNSS